MVVVHSVSIIYRTIYIIYYMIYYYDLPDKIEKEDL